MSPWPASLHLPSAHLYFMESVVVQKAQRQIADGQYDDALRTLTDLPHRWFVEREAAYLKAKADLKKYASAKEIDDDTSLQKATERLKSLVNESEAWRERAKGDLADAVAQVPRDAEDALTRGLALAKALEELQVAKGAALADALVKKAEDRSEVQSPALKATHAGYVEQILEWDPAKARKVVDLALPKQGLSQPGSVSDPRLGKAGLRWPEV